MTTTDMAEALDRSRAVLDPHVRDMLTQGRTVYSRNRDGEYAIVLTGDRHVVDAKNGDRIDGFADSRADWTIVVVDFTFRNVAAYPQDTFYAPVLNRDGACVGTIAVGDSPFGARTTDQGRVATRVVPFNLLLDGDLFCEAEADGQGRAVVFRTLGGPSSGSVLAEAVATGERRVFDDVTDHLAFQIVEG